MAARGEPMNKRTRAPPHKENPHQRQLTRVPKIKFSSTNTRSTTQCPHTRLPPRCRDSQSVSAPSSGECPTIRPGYESQLVSYRPTSLAGPSASRKPTSQPCSRVSPPTGVNCEDLHGVWRNEA